jgi:hypothetical protein
MGPNRQALDAGSSEPSGTERYREPGFEDELARERRRREELERQVRELSAENERRRDAADKADRLNRIREGLQQRGVKKANLALRLIADEVERDEDGGLVAEWEGRTLPLDEYLNRFVAENPEFLPPRIAGGSGAPPREGRERTRSGFDLEAIRPGMSPEEARQAWKEVARLMGQG